ncbi:phosphotransferase [Kribbella endophytica]
MVIELAVVAERAIGAAVLEGEVDGRRVVEYDPFLAGRSVERVTGTARLRGGGETNWSAIVKRTTGAGLRAARREAAAYLDGLTTLAPGALQAPALLGADLGDDHVEIWLDELIDVHRGAWPVERFGLAAAHVAEWAVRSCETPLPLGFDSEDAWAERHGQPHRVDDVLARLDDLRSAPKSAELATRFGDPGFQRVEALITSTVERIERLATFRQTPLHHDLVRSNLFATAGSRTAAIDWENVGHGPFGVELVPLVFGSVRRGEASGDDLPAIEDLVLSSYVYTLQSNGIDVGADVGTAFRLAVGLRWHVVLGTIEAWLDPNVRRIRGSRPSEPREESLSHLISLCHRILSTDPLIG